MYTVNLSYTASVPLLKFATVKTRLRDSEWFIIFVIIGDCVTQIRAHLSARWKGELRVGPVEFARQKEKKKATTRTRRRDNLAERKKRRGIRFIATTASHVRMYTFLYHAAKFRIIILFLSTNNEIINNNRNLHFYIIKK